MIVCCLVACYSISEEPAASVFGVQDVVAAQKAAVLIDHQKKLKYHSFVYFSQ